eukprot:m.123050 g.123050  ORF g.123050 m.123050 type:complete len:234 (+) comp12941_c0_seq37:2431-3132(+)
MESLRKKLFVQERIRLLHVADENTMESTRDMFISAFSPITEASSEDNVVLNQSLQLESEFASENRKMAVVCPVNVSYAGCAVPGANHSSPDSVYLSLASNILTTFLHKEIREHGGAYGAGCSHSGGHVRYYTYRDPSPVRSLDKFAEASDWFLENKFEDEMVNEAKLSAFQSLDGPQPPQNRGMTAFLTEVTQEQRQLRLGPKSTRGMNIMRGAFVHCFPFNFLVCKFVFEQT